MCCFKYSRAAPGCGKNTFLKWLVSKVCPDAQARKLEIFPASSLKPWAARSPGLTVRMCRVLPWKPQTREAFVAKVNGSALHRGSLGFSRLVFLHLKQIEKQIRNNSGWNTNTAFKYYERDVLCAVGSAHSKESMCQEEDVDIWVHKVASESDPDGERMKLQLLVKPDL